MSHLSAIGVSPVVTLERRVGTAPVHMQAWSEKASRRIGRGLLDAALVSPGQVKFSEM